MRNVLLPSLTVAFLWGLAPHLSKYVGATNDTTLVTWLRCCFEMLILGMVVLVVILTSQTKRVKVDAKRLRLIPLCALVSSSSVAIFIWMLQKGNTSTLVSFTYPVSLIVTLVIGHVMRDEKLTAKETAGVLIAAVACALLVS